MPADLFDLSAHYEEMLREGLKYSGEDAGYFLDGRLKNLAARLPEGFRPREVLDFGCGIGAGAAALARLFPGARVTGTDTSRPALERARASHGSARVRFLPPEELPAGAFDLGHCNGVFHHVPPAERAAALGALWTALAPGGLFAFFENNPWNPGARFVMSRIPFDRDARMISPPAARAMLSEAGFDALSTRFLFYFPRPLAFLRFAEPALARLPGGAQYGVLAVKRS